MRVLSVAMSVGLVFAVGASASADLLEYWNFNETSGTTAYAQGAWGDQNANPNHGTLIGGAAFVPGGKLGGAVLFNGSTGYIDVTSNVIPQNALEYSYNVWVKHTGIAPHLNNFLDATGGDGYNYSLNGRLLQGKVPGPVTLDVSAETLPKMSYPDDGEVSSDVSSLYTDWMMVSVTYQQNSNMKLYVNGSLVSTDTTVSGLLEVTNGLHIGAAAGVNRFWNGPIDEVAVWDNAITATEVSALWNGGAGAPAMVPEPGTLMILATGLLGLLAYVWRKHK